MIMGKEKANYRYMLCNETKDSHRFRADYGVNHDKFMIR